MIHRWGVVLVMLAGCTADAPPAVVSLPAPPAPPPPIEDSLVAVSGRALPESFMADGDVREWGSLDPPPPEPPPKKKGAAPAAASPPPPKPASRVVVGLGRARFGIVAELRKAAKEGIWIEIQFSVQELGPLGEYQRGGGVSAGWACQPNPAEGDPAEVKKCLDDLEAKQRGYNAEFLPRFSRLYRLDKDGVRLRQGGKLVAIAGAKVVAKEQGDASILEAELPLSALPRVAMSPVTSMAVGAATGDAPTLSDKQMLYAEINPPVAFAPHGELRNEFYDNLSQMFDRYHYQPGESLEVAITGYGDTGNDWSFDGMRYQERTVRLFTPQRTFGAFQIGYFYPSGIASLRGDAFVSAAKAHGEPRGMIERNGELHVFFYGHGASSDDWREHGYWTVLAVDREGAVTEKKLEMPANESLAKVLPEFHDADFAMFGYDGKQGWGNNGGEFILEHRTWKWDAKKKEYVFAMKATKLPPEKPANKR